MSYMIKYIIIIHISLITIIHSLANSIMTSKILVVAVGSTNPVKINAARNGLSLAFQTNISPDNVTGFNVPSLVPDQPMGDSETKQGAINRAKAAYDAYLDKHKVKPSFGVGLEGGIQVLNDGSNDMECFAYMVVYDGNKYGSSRTCSFNLPKAISTLVLNGMELGDADVRIFGEANSKQRGGTVGHLTKGVVDRTKYYEQAMILATIPFLNEELYS